MKDKIKQGTCDACGIKYNKEKYEVDERFVGYVWQQCPNCNYHPNNERRIRLLISQNMTANIDHLGGIQFNHRELSDIIIQEIQKIWPKLEKSKQNDMHRKNL